jgi:hypothetical protein
MPVSAEDLARRVMRFPKEFHPKDGDVLGAVVAYVNYLESSVELWKRNMLKDARRRDLGA